MGAGASTEEYDYAADLLADNNEYSRYVREMTKEDTNATPPRRNVNSADRLEEKPFGVDTIWGMYQLGRSKYGECDLFGTRSFEYPEGEGKVARGPYQWLSYNQVFDRVTELSAGLRSLGMKRDDNIGIFSENRTEWMMTALAAYSMSIRVVALYDTLGEDAIEFIMNHAETSVVFCSKKTVKTVTHDLKKLPKLKYMVQFDVNDDFGNRADIVDEEDVKLAKKHNVELIGFTELMQRGKASPCAFDEPKGEDLALIMYTSGTTGTPKGVMLQHRNIAAAATGVPGFVPHHGEDKFISYLPLAHIFETLIQAYCMVSGMGIGFFQGDVRKLTDDLCTLQPALMAGVPRVFQRMYDKIMAGINSKVCPLRYIMQSRYASQLKCVREGPADPSYDFFHAKIRAKVGLSKVRAVVTGGAPCPPYLQEFMKVVFACHVFQGYGLTETAAAAFINFMDDHKIGHVGAPNLWAEARLKSVEEMNYLATNDPPTGEIQIRGAGVFKGYYKDEDKTKEAFDDGWFRTGDIGRWNPNGTLSIIDRKKNIFKLAQGEYIAVDKVESAYGKSSHVAQLFVYGNSYKPVLVAVVVPSAEALAQHIKSSGMAKLPALTDESFPEEFTKVFDANRDALTKVVFDEMRKEESSLKGFEKVKKIYCESRIDNQFMGFTVENNTLTPTFKPRRPQLKERYLSQLKQMYTDLGDPPKKSENW